MNDPPIKNTVRGKLLFILKIGFGYFWDALGTVGRLWAKPGPVKVVLGKKEGVNNGDKSGCGSKSRHRHAVADPPAKRECLA